jgi:hypothetical protein
MSERALEFVETWVSEKIEEMEELPEADDEKAPKALADACTKAALEEDIPASEIAEAFDDLAEFIGGELEEERERREGGEKEEEVDALFRDDVEDEEDKEDE